MHKYQEIKKKVRKMLFMQKAIFDKKTLIGFEI